MVEVRKMMIVMVVVVMRMRMENKDDGGRQRSHDDDDDGDGDDGDDDDDDDKDDDDCGEGDQDAEGRGMRFSTLSHDMLIRRMTIKFNITCRSTREAPRRALDPRVVGAHSETDGVAMPDVSPRRALLSMFEAAQRECKRGG